MKRSKAKVTGLSLLFASALAVASAPALAQQTEPEPTPSNPTPSAQPQPTAPPATAPAPTTPAPATTATGVTGGVQVGTGGTGGEGAMKPAAPMPKAERKITPQVIAAGSVAGVALITGVVLGVIAAGKHSDFRKNADDYKNGGKTSTSLNDAAKDAAESGEKMAFGADVSFGIAGLFGLTALALYLLPDDPTPAGAAALPAKTTAKSVLKSVLTGQF